MNSEALAFEVMKCTITHEPEAKLLGNISAQETMYLMSLIITACPKCGSEAWVNVDCNMCLLCTSLSNPT